MVFSVTYHLELLKCIILNRECKNLLGEVIYFLKFLNIKSYILCEKL